MFISKMLNGEVPTIYGDGQQTRDFTYIDDVVTANLLVADAEADAIGGKVFNVATGQEISLNEVAEILRSETGYQGNINYGPERSGDLKHSRADISLIGKQLNFVPRIEVHEGLRRTVAWYRTRSR